MANLQTNPSNTGYNTVTTTPRVFAKSGNKILIQFAGVTIGLCQSVDIQEDYGLEPCSGIGSIEVSEWVPTLARYTVHVEEIILQAGSMRSAGLIPEDAAAALVGKQFDITFVSTGNTGIAGAANTTVDAIPALDRVIQGCTYASGNVRIEKNRVVIASAVFNAISVKGKAI